VIRNYVDYEPKGNRLGGVQIVDRAIAGLCIHILTEPTLEPFRKGFMALRNVACLRKILSVAYTTTRSWAKHDVLVSLYVVIQALTESILISKPG
jgi:hypothetical protein